MSRDTVPVSRAEIVVEEPYLAIDRLTWRSHQSLGPGHRVQTLVGGLVDEPALLGMDPLLVAGAGVAGHHADGLDARAGGLGHLRAGVLPPQLVGLAEGEELAGRGVLVAGVHAKVVRVLVVVLEIEMIFIA